MEEALRAEWIRARNQRLAQIYIDITDACHRLADGLGGFADAGQGGRAARDLARLFGEIADHVAEANAENDRADTAEARAREMLSDLVPDEFVIDDDGPRAGVLCRATPADYAMPLSDVIRDGEPDQFGRLPGADHYGCPTGPICVGDGCRRRQ